MASVSRKEGFRYGFYLFSYWLVLLIFSGALVVAGAALVEQQIGGIGANREGALAVLGGFVSLLGVVVYGSGQVGIVYKLVADGVDRGGVTGDAANAAPSGSETETEGRSMGTTAEPEPDRPAETTEGTTGSAGPADRTESVDPESGREPADAARPNGEPGTEPTGAPGTEAATDAGDPTAADASSAGGATDGSEAGAPPDGDDEAAGTPAGPDEDATTRDGSDAGGDARPAGESGTGATGEGPATGPAGEDPGGDSEGDDGDDDPGSSPVDVASESEIAEQLGFADSPGGDGRDAQGADDRPTEDGSGGDPLAPDTGGDDPDSPDEADDGDGSGSLADALAATDDEREGGDEDENKDEDGASDGDTPEWTTGENHMGGPNSTEE
jgi:hypothetical protein